MNNFIKLKLQNIYSNAVRIAKRPDGIYRTSKENLYTKRIKRKFDIQYKYVDDQLKLFSEEQGKEAYINLTLEMPEQEGIAGLLYDEETLLLDRGAKQRLADIKESNITWDIENKEAQQFLESRRGYQLLDTFQLNGTFAPSMFDYLNIHESTQKQMMGLFEKTFAGSMSIPELRKKLADDYLFSYRRADLLAYRGSAEAFAQGDRYIVDEFIARNPLRTVIHSWVTVKDIKVTRECRANELQGWLPNDKVFSSGDITYPRKSHPFVCRCNTITKILAPNESIDKYLGKRDGDLLVNRKISGSNYPINKREDRFLNTKGIKTIERRTAFLDGRGGFDPKENLINVKSGISQIDKQKTFLHEYGHGLDSNFDGMGLLSNKKDGFKALIKDKRYTHGLNKESIAIIEGRFNREPQNNFRIPSNDFSNFLSGKEVIDNTGVTRKASGFVREYYGNHSEMFAESYLQYRTEPKFGEYAPKIKDYFDYITGLQDI